FQTKARSEYSTGLCQVKVIYPNKQTKSMIGHVSIISSFILLLACAVYLFAQTAPANGVFQVKVEAGAIVSLRRSDDSFPTDYIQSGRRLGDVFLRYRGKDGAWQSADTALLAGEGN